MPVTDLQQLFLKGLDSAKDARLGLAVSGGGDSMAMLHLAHQVGLNVQVATVDHGLRPESAKEARMVASVCADLGFHHETLHWLGWNGQGNTQDAARRARRTLLAAWATRHQLQHLAMGHTADDLAESLLMRLARGAGLDGMAAMEAHWHHAGLRWHRPLLTAPRQLLRDYLNERGAIWVEDPSNESDDFERVRIRRALPMLAPLGLTIDRLAEVALHLREAKNALDQVTDTAFATFSFDRGTVCFAVDCLGLHPPDIQRRLLQKVLMWISPSDYGPRGPALQRLRHSLLAQHDATLAGCRFLVNGGAVRALRELNAVGPCVAQGEIWDGRWQITGPTLEGAVIGPLGVLGLAQVPNWRGAALPRAALLSSPALWLGTRLIAAPFAHFGHEWAAIAALQSQRSNSITLTH